MKYDVLRQHLGDRLYLPGDVRDANEGDVRELVERGVLRPTGKAEAPLADKAEPRVLNKARK